jgi:O-acetyl-ADP-ribose deacetylase (regulator of RNase III)
VSFQTVDGNVLDVTEGIIAHQTNCQGVMGSGVALAIRNKYPKVYEEYTKHCDQFTPNQLLGTVQFVTVNPKLYVANVFGQDSFGAGRRQTSYDATVDAWKILFDHAEFLDWSIYIPHLMGCALGGGNWYIYTSIIQSFQSKIPVTAVRLV